MVYLDQRNNRPLSIELGGIPWIPGTGNQLTWSAVPGAGDPSSRDYNGILEGLARAFIDQNALLLKVNNADLTRNNLGSSVFDSYVHQGELTYRYGIVDLAWKPNGIPVEGAHIMFLVNHGNLVNVGMSRVGDTAQVPLIPSLNAGAALASLTGKMKCPISAGVPQLIILPTASDAPGSDPTNYTGPLGDGYTYRLVWLIPAVPKIPPVGSLSLQAYVDAIDGSVLCVRDDRVYGSAYGAVVGAGTQYFPFVDVIDAAGPNGTSANVFADENGNFASRSDQNSHLLGKYFAILNCCGNISTTSYPDLNFGAGPLGTVDCNSASSLGGAGDTDASRSTYYYLNQIRTFAQGQIPFSCPWLSTQVPANTDRVQNFYIPGGRCQAESLVCDAYWQQGQLYFGVSGSYLPGHGSCNNFGTVPGPIYHEWGHGLDENDGHAISESDLGSAEAYADSVAFTKTHDACIGRGLHFPCGTGMTYSCSSDCDGVRQVHGSTTVAQVASYCPYDSSPSHSYIGPCGREAHCESSPPAEALWDLATYDLPRTSRPGLCRGTADPVSSLPLCYSSEQAWDTATRLFYMSRSVATQAFSCTGDGGTGDGTLYRALRFVDACPDGDTLKGTRNAHAIFAALARHGIAEGLVTAQKNLDNDCDYTAPSSVAITAPANGAVISGNPVEVDITAADNVGIAKVELFIDDPSLSYAARYTATAAPYRLFWDTGLLQVGSTHKLQARAFDFHGNATLSALIQISVGYVSESVPPTVQWVKPLDGQYVSGAVLFSVDAHDNTVLDRVEFDVGIRHIDTVVSPASNGLYEARWDTAGATGVYAPTATAVDRSGNRTEATITLHVNTSPPDTIQPTVSVTDPAEGATVSGLVSLAATAADNTGVAHVQLKVDGCTFYDDQFAPYTANWDTTKCSNGPHAVTATAYDQAGNTAVAVVHVTVSNAVPSSATLLSGRFEVSVAYRNQHNNTTGVGQPVEYSDNTALFTFFTADNVELVVKVLDGRSLNHNFWVFWGTLTDLDVTISVTDTTTAVVRQYTKAVGSACGGADTSAFYDAGQSGAVAPGPVGTPALSLLGGRFRVETTFKQSSGGSSTPGHAVAYSGDESGFFWFFQQGNVELMLKMLDGRGTNGKFWLFFGPLTSVEFTVTVTDTVSGAVRDYRKASDTTFCGTQDTAAF